MGRGGRWAGAALFVALCACCAVAALVLVLMHLAADRWGMRLNISSRSATPDAVLRKVSLVTTWGRRQVQHDVPQRKNVARGTQDSRHRQKTRGHVMRNLLGRSLCL